MNDLKPIEPNCLCWVLSGPAAGTTVTALSYKGDLSDFHPNDLWEVDREIEWYCFDEMKKFPYISARDLMRIDGDPDEEVEESKELELVE